MIVVVFFIGITGVVFYMNRSNDSELVDCDTQTSYSEEDNTALDDVFSQSDEFKMKYADIIAGE